METTTCPPRERLKDYLYGKLELDDSRMLEQHLTDCSSCEETATSIELESETLIERLRQSPPQPDDDAASFDGSSEGVPLGLAPGPRLPSSVGAYELLSRLGRGGMGTVYLARHTSLDRHVAVKLLPSLPAQNAEFVARFQREMRAAGRLDHPAIVRVTDAGEADGVHFLVMEAIDGLDLSYVARSIDRLGIADACEIVRQTALGLSHAHAKGVVHRDIKPSNLMLDGAGQVRILDFGLAQIGMWEAGSAEITTVGQLMGTLDYMAPEQADRGGAVDYRADLYSLGATLFRLLTGRAPLAAAPDLTPLEKLRLLATHKPPKLQTLRSDVPETLGDVVDSLLAREPGVRPASATHAAELLQPFCAENDLPALLERVRSLPHPDEQLQQEIPAWLRATRHDNVKRSPSRPIADNAPTNGRKSTLTWLFGTLTTLLLAAGAGLVIDTTRGQLVIESEADVHVKLARVEPTGTTDTIDDLHIQPGSQATRLWSGTYQITIDAASDLVAISRDTFSIQHGETVVARVTSRARNSTTQATDHPAYAAQLPTRGVDPRLDHVVYNGESLDTWVRRLENERNPEKLAEATTAITALASPELRDIVEQPLIRFLIRHPQAEGALKALAKVAGPKLFDDFTSILKSLGNYREQEALVTEGKYLASWARATLTPNNLASFLNWASEVFKTDSEAPGQSSVLAGKTSLMLRDMLCEPGATQLSTDAQEAVLDTLLAAERLTNVSFWLFAEKKDPSRWSPVWKKELLRRSIQAVAQPATDQEFVCGSIMLQWLVEAGGALSDRERDDVAAALAKRLRNMASQPEVISQFQEINLSVAMVSSTAPRISSRSVTSLPMGMGDSNRNFPVNLLAVTLRLVATIERQQTLQVELEALYDMLHHLPIGVHHLPIGGGVSPSTFLDEPATSTVSWPSMPGYSAEIRKTMHKQILFVQCGELLGKSLADLRARLSGRTAADLEHAVRGELDILANNTNTLRCNEALGQIDHQLRQYDNGPSRSEAIASALISYFVRNMPDLVAGGFYQEYTSTLALGCGDRFVSDLTNLLRELMPDQRAAVLRWSTPVILPRHCQTPDQLSELLDWTDQLIAAHATQSAQTIEEAAKLLRHLLQDKMASPACQGVIIDRLQTYSEDLPESFWFGVDESRDVSYCVEFRQMRMSQAIEALDARNSSRTLQCNASLTIGTLLADSTPLTQSDRDTVIGWVRNCLKQAVSDPAQHIGLHATYLRGHPVQPRFLGAEGNDMASFVPLATEMGMGGGITNALVLADPRGVANSEHKAVANRVVLALNLVPKIDATDALRNDITRLMESVADVKPIDEIRVYGHQPQELQWGLGNIDLAQLGFMGHVWYVQSGCLLGGKFDELWNGPHRQWRAEEQAKLELVQPHDTLAIHIPMLLPRSGDPPILQAGVFAPVVGVPVPVTEHGKIVLPAIGEMSVDQLELSEVRKAIQEACSEIFREPAKSITVQFLMRASSPMEIRNLTGQNIPTE